jgi:hypothetical protein
VTLPSALGISGDLTAASAALAGLILVFLGSTATSFESYQKQEQASVRARYQRRAWLAFTGLVLCLVALLLSLLGGWLAQECMVLGSLALLVLATGWVLFAALAAVREIK